MVAGVLLAALLAALLPQRSPAEPMMPLLTSSLLSSGGHYVIANYTGPYFVIWDMERLWDRHQPSQVLVVQRGTGNYGEAMPLALSEDAGWLAFQDWTSKEIYLCKMRQDFPCRLVYEPGEEVISMVLSTHGDHLLLQTPKQLLSINVANGKPLVLPLPIEGYACLVANWEKGVGAVGTLDGNIHIFDLSSLKSIANIRLESAADCQLFMTKDNLHMVSYWRYESFENGFYESHQSVMLHRLQPPGTPPVKSESEVYIVPGDQAGDLWQVGETYEEALSLTPLGPDGKLLSEKQVQIMAGPYARVEAVSSAKNIVLISMNEGLFIYDLRSLLPIAELYASKVVYGSDGKRLLHLTPGLGADPAYHQLEALSMYYGRNFSLNEFTFPSPGQMEEKKQALLWMAVLAAKRGDRYDPIWFDLLAVYRNNTEAPRAYYQLAKLCRLLIQLNYSEYLLDTEQYERAVVESTEALRTLRSTPELQPLSGKLDIYEPNLSDLVLSYARILERHLWLVLGEGLRHQGQYQQAELAYRGALRMDAYEWQAYDGILQAHIASDRTQMDALLTEANRALKLEYWEGFDNSKTPTEFFLKEENEQLQGINPDPRGESLNLDLTP
jgi:tetratricopeptide (TPR) repeat protein